MSSQDSYEEYEKKVTNGILKIFFPILIICTQGIVYSQFRSEIESNQKLLIVSLVVFLITGFFVVRQFISFYQYMVRSRSPQHQGETGQTSPAVAITVMPWRHPLLKKFQVIVIPIVSLFVTTGLATLYLRDVPAFWYVIGLLIIAILYNTYVQSRTPFQVLLFNNNVVFSSSVMSMQQTQSIAWDDFLKYLYKIEYDKTNKVVIFFTGYPSLIKSKNFSPWKYFFIGYSANFIIPVMNDQEAAKVIEFVELKKTKVSP